MRRKNLAAIFTVIILATLAMPVFADDKKDEDTDSRLVNAKVVEVTDARISVIARTGVEHVIAINDTGTKVSVEGKEISLKDLREGDVVTIELDEVNPLKFAKNIELASQSIQEVARRKP